ncbi:MAG: hypothetical protein BWY99_01471 [Synergistetes bacterium ADurb.BinA166]|nr:MAG: hypothetical protein BWY99_01471 [Synergistetes bacterium ADurb.BinA166]
MATTTVVNRDLLTASCRIVESPEYSYLSETMKTLREDVKEFGAQAAMRDATNLVIQRGHGISPSHADYLQASIDKHETAVGFELEKLKIALSMLQALVDKL